MSAQFHSVENPDSRAWDDFVCAHNGHLLQSAAWGALKSRFGWTATRVALAQANTIVAAAQILFRRLPLGLVLGYVPRGPVVEPTDSATFAALLEVLCATAQGRGAFALKIEPNWQQPQLTADIAAGTPEPLRGWRLGPSHQPRTTIHLDLSRDLDTILAQMKPKWRYNIRLAARKGVSIRQATAADVPLFYSLLQVTSARDRFAIHSSDYYRAAFDLLGDHACLLVAEFDRQPLAAIFVTAFGTEAIYLYGASSNERRDCMPNHALHWAAIQWARSRGCTRYDLWGIAEGGVPIQDQGNSAGIFSSFIPHPSSLPDGLYQFKQGFGGSVVRYANAYDKVFSPVRFTLYTRALALRRGGMA